MGRKELLGTEVSNATVQNTIREILMIGVSLNTCCCCVSSEILVVLLYACFRVVYILIRVLVLLIVALLTIVLTQVVTLCKKKLYSFC